jgi:hypothetical protein
MLVDRASPSASFASESGDDDYYEEHHRSASPPLSDVVSKGSNSSNTIATTNCLMRRYAAQSRANVLRSTSISPLIIQKPRQTLLNSKNILQRSILQSSSEIKSNPSIEKKQNHQSRPTNKVITSTSIISPTRKSTTNNTPRSTSLNFPKVRQSYFLYFQILRFFFRNIN